MSNELFKEVWIVAVLTVLVLTIVPLVIGVAFSLLLGLTGIMYFVGVMTVASAIWLMLGLLWWS